MKILKNQSLLIKTNFSFLKVAKKYFKLMTPEECLVNMKNSQGKMDIQQCKMNPLPEASNKN